MQHTIWEWIGDEAPLAHAVSGLSTLMLIVVIVVCILLLSKGADWMIDGVVDLANRTGIPKIVIGATIISLGTTMPEAFVSVMAAFMGNPGLALGNGVGSIIADTGLIFGLTCVLAGTVPANKFILNRTGWVQVGSATLLVVIALGILFFSSGPPVLGRSFGIFFLILLAIYMYATYMWAKSGTSQFEEGENNKDNGELISIFQCWVMVIGGLSLVVIGARILVPCASEIAMRFGVPDDVIAATMVAFGTSLPELMTAISAIKKGHPEITVGNIVGADVLNCLFVIGAAATAKPLAIPENFYFFHFPAMLIILWSFRAFISMNKDGRFKRWQGVYLIGIYLSYVVLQYVLNVELPA